MVRSRRQRWGRPKGANRIPEPEPLYPYRGLCRAVGVVWSAVRGGRDVGQVRLGAAVVMWALDGLLRSGAIAEVGRVLVARRQDPTPEECWICHPGRVKCRCWQEVGYESRRAGAAPRGLA